MSAMPDRQGHAYNPNPQAASTSQQVASQPQGSDRQVIVQENERLFQVADRAGCPLWDLITHNELVAAPKAGDSLNVPR